MRAVPSFVTVVLVVRAFDACLARAAEAPDARGQDAPRRPTIACTAELVPPGTTEIEAGALYRRLGAARQWTFPFLVKLTAAPWVQLQVGSNGFTNETGGASARISALSTPISTLD